jgi:hypothetical protein
VVAHALFTPLERLFQQAWPAARHTCHWALRG